MTDRRVAGLGDGPKRNNGAYTKNRREFKARCRSRNLPCAICKGELGPIDYDAAQHTAKAFELDHIQPVKTHPHLFYMPSNWQPAHSACNRSRQAKDMALLSNTQPKTLPSDHADGSSKWVKPRW